jgi:hypothetical protein
VALPLDGKIYLFVPAQTLETEKLPMVAAKDA